MTNLSHTSPMTGHERAQIALIATAVLTLLIFALPSPWDWYVGYPFVLLATTVHELGHGIAGLLVGGQFNSFQVYANASGLAHVGGYSGRVSSAIVSAGGLVGPAIMAAVCFLIARWGLASKIAFIVFGLFLAIVEILVVRNLFGFFIVGLFAAACLAVGIKLSRAWCQICLLFLAVQLSLSVYSGSGYLFVREAHVDGQTLPSDVANMSEALFLPYWFWGLVCAAFSLAVLVAGLWLFLSGAFKARKKKVRNIV